MTAVNEYVPKDTSVANTDPVWREVIPALCLGLVAVFFPRTYAALPLWKPLAGICRFRVRVCEAGAKGLEVLLLLAGSDVTTTLRAVSFAEAKLAASKRNVDNIIARPVVSRQSYKELASEQLLGISFDFCFIIHADYKTRSEEGARYIIAGLSNRFASSLDSNMVT